MVVLLFGYVYLNIPRIDFFLCSVLFLTAFITMFYFDDDALLAKLLRFYLIGTLIFLALFVFKIPSLIDPVVPYSADWLTMVFIAAYIFYVRGLVRRADPLLRKKFRISLILSFAAPFSVGAIFKYLLLVPMPFEGLIVVVMDAIRYWDF